MEDSSPPRDHGETQKEASRALALPPQSRLWKWWGVTPPPKRPSRDTSAASPRRGRSFSAPAAISQSQVAEALQTQVEARRVIPTPQVWPWLPFHDTVCMSTMRYPYWYEDCNRNPFQPCTGCGFRPATVVWVLRGETDPMPTCLFRCAICQYSSVGYVAVQLHFQRPKRCDDSIFDQAAGRLTT